MKHLLLLHGAIGAKDQLASLSAKLEKDYQVHSLNFNGHGGEIPSSDTFSISSFATDVLNYLQQNNIQQAAIFGYSMGGYVAMYLARHYPQTVTAICTLGTKFYWDEVVAAKETKMLNPAVIEEKVPAFAEQLQKRHSVSAWKEVLEKTKALLIQLGKNNILQLEDYHKYRFRVYCYWEIRIKW